MSSWSTLTMKIDSMDDRTDTTAEELQQKVLDYIKEKDGKATTYINHLRNVWVKPYGVNTEQMMKDLASHWSQAVIITANNTSDTGTATLYEKDVQYGEPNVWSRDKYTEMQKDDGCFTGRKAAAYMMFAHGIECDSDYRMKWTDNEKSIGWDKEENDQ